MKKQAKGPFVDRVPFAAFEELEFELVLEARAYESAFQLENPSTSLRNYLNGDYKVILFWEITYADSFNSCQSLDFIFSHNTFPKK